MKGNPSNIESQIVELLVAGDKKAISLLFQNYSGALLGIINRMIPSKEIAEEVLQDVFVKVWNNANKYDPEKGRLYTWLAQIARHSALDKIRSKGYRNEGKTDSIDNPVSNFNEPALAVDLPDSGLKKVVTSLREDYRILINYAYYKGYSQSEIAKELSIPLGTVKTKTRAALKELRKLLGNEHLLTIFLAGWGSVV